MTSDIKEKIKMSKIEQLIGEIEEFIDGCNRFQAQRLL